MDDPYLLLLPHGLFGMGKLQCAQAGISICFRGNEDPEDVLVRILCIELLRTAKAEYYCLKLSSQSFVVFPVCSAASQDVLRF